MLVEQARELVADGATLDEALAQVRAKTVFTIHTPVPAGNERFGVDHGAQPSRRRCWPASGHRR